MRRQAKAPTASLVSSISPIASLTVPILRSKEVKTVSAFGINVVEGRDREAGTINGGMFQWREGRENASAGFS